MSRPHHPQISPFLLKLPSFHLHHQGEGPRLQQINIAALGFLGGPPPKGVQMVQLPIERAPKEEVTSLSPASVKKVPGAIEVVDSKEGFEVFD